MKANTKWQVSGDAAERYEENLVPVIFIPWAQELLKRAELVAGDAVLDAACGTGIVARMASDRVGPDAKVVGADINAGMLAVARSKSEEEGKLIDWVEADVGNLPFDDASFDAVFCQQGLQFFPDKLIALKEFRRVLKPGGRCVICVARSLEHNPLMNGQIEILTRYIGEDAANAIRAVCGLSDSGMIHDLFTGAGFPEIDIESVTLTLRHPDGKAFVAGNMLSTPAANAISKLLEEKRQELFREFLNTFGSYYDGHALAFPHASHVVHARA
ncbi:methyltransferase domain-containing protein [Pseudohalocynthiibacter aestuariivivens]|uniref:Methyltransferase domain-containing protein n=1 Tax=Pseudohalocynthiibacter aestuariivivens TaxID=1591409 RepID=A0ABV5JGM2_9RHOB|nr:methyltransferase domain-containing protein [Pseudohalocynthiibacter aestuariivivens]MBS9719025.1 methyltransferase domain-containing protein [Pseudohalocynthiibacter aestuariivivens]